MTALEPYPARTGSPRAPRNRSAARVRDFLALTKPRIIELLLVTTIPVMFLADRGVPSVWLVLATLVGGTFSAGAANALNCYLDRDIDSLMPRTGNRPLVTGAVRPREALVFGVTLAVASVAWLALTVNLVSALLSLLAVVLYVGLYTMLLKRRTSQNIVWGGIAGCMPVLIGWSAVTGELGWPALMLFLVVFFWTPAHYWPLSMRFKDEYTAAGVPMLPVVASATAVARQVVAYSWATVALSLGLVPVASMGWLYLLAAVSAGAVFVFEAHRLLWRARSSRSGTLASLQPMRLFHYSISYLTVLFVAVALDSLLHLSL